MNFIEKIWYYFAQGIANELFPRKIMPKIPMKTLRISAFKIELTLFKHLLLTALRTLKAVKIKCLSEKMFLGKTKKDCKGESFAYS